MPVQLERIRKDIETIARCTATPGAGATRPTFSQSWADATGYLMEELRRIGCEIRVDAAGNVHARPAALGWDRPAWASGSHLDSVPHGGDYDGVAGVMVPLEILRSAQEEGWSDPPLELIAFAEEEGPTFGLGMLGSRALVGELGPEELGRLHNASGQTYLQAGTPHGVVTEGIGVDLLRKESLLGFIEVHAEQGPGMWKNAQPVAVVSAIAGRFQYRAEYVGQANHAGSTSMFDRQDAMAGAAELMHRLEQLATELSPETVLTVGELHCLPNAINVIPETVRFTIDFRSPDNQLLQTGHRRIEELTRSIAAKRKLRVELEQTEAIAAVQLDASLVAGLDLAATRAGPGPLPKTVSGALHDAAVLAPHLPTVMLFVASRDGISHNPNEFSRVQDITLAARILQEFLHENGSRNP